MALIDYIDAELRLIHLSADTMNTAWHPVDLYREVRALRGSDETLRKYDNFMRGAGNIDKGGGKATERYFTLLDGTRIVPYDESHIIDITGTLITDDGYEGAFCFDKSLLSVGVSVDIQYAPKQVEVINLNFDDLVYSSFQGAVWLDVINGHSDKGTDNMPNGNTERPVSTMQLATEIAAERGFRIIQVIGNLTLGAGDDVRGLRIEGTSHIHSVLDVGYDAQCENTQFCCFDITGFLDGGSEIKDCIVRDLIYFNGSIAESALVGKITLAGNKDAHFKACYMYDFSSVPTLDCGGFGQNAIFSEYSAKIIIANLTGANRIGIGLSSGGVIVDGTCTAGTIILNGNGSADYLAKGEDCYVINRLVSGRDIHNISRQVEFLRPHHTGTGDTIFWNPYSGNDNWDGGGADTAFKTFARAHDAVRNANHDTIMIVPGDPTGVTRIAEHCVITKDYLFIRGPGRDVIFECEHDIPSITSHARGTQLAGFRLAHTDPTTYAVHTTSGFTMISNLWFESCGNGIYFEGGDHPIIHSCKFHASAGTALKIDGNVAHGEIYDCTFGGSGDVGIDINTADGWGGIKMRDSIIMHSPGIGVRLSATTIKFIANDSNIIRENVGGDVVDNGSSNVYPTLDIIEARMHHTFDSYTSKDDWKADTSVVPADVWSYVARELTVTAGLTPEQEAKLDEIIIDIAELPEPQEMSELELHSGLDSYNNKDDWKSNTGTLSTNVNIIEVAGVAVTGVDDFKADSIDMTETNAKIDAVKVDTVAIKAKTDILESYDDAAIDAKLDAISVLIASIPTEELTAEQHAHLMSLVNADFTDTNAKIDIVPTAVENADELLGRVI